MSNSVLVDATKCIGCRACQVACKQWNHLDSETTTNRGTCENPPKLSADTYTKMRFTELENAGQFKWVFTKLQCMHCEDPGCASACPTKALHKLKSGPVVYDKSKCIGCRYCMVACPFEIPTYQWDSTTPWIRKCTFCADRQAAGLQPACVTTCPSGALKFGDREELLAEARERIDKAAPGKYVNHIYGEKEVGGTSWLYLSPVPFDAVGFRELKSDPVTNNPDIAMKCVPPVLVGVAVVMAGCYWVIKRRNRLSQENTGANAKEEAIK